MKRCACAKRTSPAGEGALLGLKGPKGGRKRGHKGLTIDPLVYEELQLSTAITSAPAQHKAAPGVKCRN